MITGNMQISNTESFLHSCKLAIQHEFKTRHHKAIGLYTPTENVRDAIAIIRRIQPKNITKQSKP